MIRDPDSLWEFEIISRLDFDAGNHDKRKYLITREELMRHISHPENLGHSVNAVLAVLKLGKNKTVVNIVRDIIEKLGGTHDQSPCVRSAFTLIPEGKFKLYSSDNFINYREICNCKSILIYFLLNYLIS